MNTSLFERAKYLFITLSAVAVVFAIPTWAQDEDEGWVEVWKPRRLLQLRIKFEHCAWLRVIREEAAAQERWRRVEEGAGAWFWAGLMSEDSSEGERER